MFRPLLCVVACLLLVSSAKGDTFTLTSGGASTGFGHIGLTASGPNISIQGGWAVGSFFIPFVNLVVPYRAVKEVWQKSWPQHEALLSEPSPPARFPIWWLFWLVSSFAGNISMRASFNENVSASTAMMISIVASGLSVVAAIFAYLVVDTIDKRQEETSRQLKLGKFAEPPLPTTNLPLSGVASESIAGL